MATQEKTGDVTLNESRRKVLCLFDVDGTLTKFRQRNPEMEELLDQLQKKVDVALVSGSDLAKIAEQMGVQGTESSLINRFPFIFAENGLVAYVRGIPQESESILSFMGEEKLQSLINFCLKYLSELILPCKRGNFIEFRSGLINVCPVGRTCSQSERDAFGLYDEQHKIREKLVSALIEKFGEEQLLFKIGGQISVDIFPKGWDKTYCLKYLNDYEEIHFFGDRTFPGGNDYEIYSHPRTKGHSVSSPEETREILKKLFF